MTPYYNSPPGAGPSTRSRTLMRLRGLIRKEFLQAFRDPSSLGIAFVLPVVLLLLFGYGVSLDAEHVPLALVVEKPTPDTASLCGAFEQSHYFEPVYLHGMHAALQALAAHRIIAIVHLREDFSRRLRSPDNAAIQLIVNGVDANTARIIEGYVEGVYGNWLEDYAVARGRPLNIPVRIEQRVWFNSNLRSRNFLVPGLVAVIMTLIGALLTALLMAREWERGTMEALMVTPVTIREILIGKIVPYFILGMGGMALSVIMAVWQFKVPLRGSIWVLLTGNIAVFADGSRDGAADFDDGQKSICCRTGGHHYHLSAGVYPVWIYFRYRQHAAGHPAPSPTSSRRATLSAILQTVFLAGDVWHVICAQRPGSDGHGDDFHRPDAKKNP